MLLSQLKVNKKQLQRSLSSSFRKGLNFISYCCLQDPMHGDTQGEMGGLDLNIVEIYQIL